MLPRQAADLKRDAGRLVPGERSLPRFAGTDPHLAETIMASDAAESISALILEIVYCNKNLNESSKALDTQS